ncbi:ASCH domain-containing protein [Aquincola tertiaricarbonis]|uniref:ASCH domain-containing protein n=1 Tax=Aquincola tertiaricarbonis TaxID=391953 RepID=UPI00061521E3|nr:ASCH domain-containing protein [Aquincola tertiaricarbonis]
MLKIPQYAQSFWDESSRAVGGLDPARFYEAFSFGDSAALADTLAGLVLSGVKRGTASSLWSYAVQGKPLPVAGDLSVMTAGDKTPLCLIRTVEVQIVPFDEVTAAFAFAEGEGDRTLDSWRAEHERYFKREAVTMPWSFAIDMPIVCELFEVVHVGHAALAFVGAAALKR